MGADGFTVTTGAPRAAQLVGDALGEELGGLVRSHHVRERDGRPLVTGGAVLGNAHGAHGGRVDDALDTGQRGGLEHVAGAVDIGAVERAGIGRPEPVVGGDVIDAARAGDGGADGVDVEQVALRDVDGAALERAPIAALAGEDAHAMTVADELADEVRAHEAGAARHEDVHQRPRSLMRDSDRR